MSPSEAKLAATITAVEAKLAAKVGQVMQVIVDEVDEDGATFGQGFEAVPGLVQTVIALGLAKKGDDAMIVVACELVLEALVARRKISRSDAGAYGRAERESRRKPGQDYFG